MALDYLALALDFDPWLLDTWSTFCRQKRLATTDYGSLVYPYFHQIAERVASYSRFDALLGANIHIAMWGSINLINNRVSMTLGITPTTLSERFKIAGLQKQDMFQVLMRGTTETLELDWSSAYTRIAFLVARTAGGHLGLIIGGLLEPIITASLGEDPVPPPTTSPLPWESQYSSEPGQTIPREASPRSRKGTRRFSEYLNP